MSAYTVQVQVSWEDDAAVREGWEDIAVVEVPHRTKRRTIIERALEQAAYDPAKTANLKVRVLDEASAREVPVTTKNRDPEWEIG